MVREEILRWLLETDSARLRELWGRADEVRRRHVGDAVHLRGLIEFSNRCVRQCGYCGMRAGNTELPRYRMASDEILACAHLAMELGYGTLVLQSGEDPSMDPEWLAAVVRGITTAMPLAVTLSVGEWPPEAFRLWREAGADRYLLRFETADEDLLRRIHPPLPGRPRSRFEILRSLRDLGYEVGSGILIGFPGQTFGELARCIELLRELELDMIGSGPFIPHPETPLGRSPVRSSSSGGESGAGAGGLSALDQVPPDDLMTYKVLALARIVRPFANIPATTALATLDRASGYEKGLQRGANVIMPNVTPVRYRSLYHVYPGKVSSAPGDTYYADIKARIEALGRTVGVGPGSSACRSGAAASCP
jgi:biotin synthase